VYDHRGDPDVISYRTTSDYTSTYYERDTFHFELIFHLSKKILPSPDTHERTSIPPKGCEDSELVSRTHRCCPTISSGREQVNNPKTAITVLIYIDIKSWGRGARVQEDGNLEKVYVW